MHNSYLDSHDTGRRHLPYGIIPCYLLPERKQVNAPRLNHSPRVLDLPTPEGWKAELTYRWFTVVKYIPTAFTSQETVTDPSSNRPEANALTGWLVW